LSESRISKESERPVESNEGTPVTATLTWLEEEYRQSKAQINRLQQQMEQLLNLTRDTSDKLRAAEENVGVLTAKLNVLPKLEDEIRQLRDLVGKVHAAQGQDAARMEEIERARRGESDRDRQSRSEMWHRLDYIEGQKDALQAKVDVLDENQKKYQDNIAMLHQHLDKVGRQNEVLEGRIQRTLEQGRHEEQEFTRLSREIDALRHQDEVISSRVQIAADQVKRIDEQNQEIISQESLKLDLSEKIDSIRADQQRTEKLLVEVQQISLESRERLEGHARLLSRLETRLQTNADNLAEARQQALEIRQQLAEQIMELLQLQEQQRRRSMSALEQDLQEIRHLTSKPLVT